MTALFVIVAVAALVVVWGVVTYNTLVRARNRVDEAWSDIDVQLMRRHDLVPNLVETVKGYAAHEGQTLTAVTNARADALVASSRVERGLAESELSAMLVQVRVVAERYPQLKASDNFKLLQSELTEVEDEISAARQIYNSNVKFLNTRIQSFPTSLIAGLASFESRDFFELQLEADLAVPQASFA